MLFSRACCTTPVCWGGPCISNWEGNGRLPTYPSLTSDSELVKQALCVSFSTFQLGHFLLQVTRWLIQLLTIGPDLSSHVPASTSALSRFNSISGAQDPARPSIPSPFFILPPYLRQEAPLSVTHCLFRADWWSSGGWIQFCLEW